MIPYQYLYFDKLLLATLNKFAQQVQIEGKNSVKLIQSRKHIILIDMVIGSVYIDESLFYLFQSHRSS